MRKPVILLLSALVLIAGCGQHISETEYSVMTNQIAENRREINSLQKYQETMRKYINSNSVSSATLADNFTVIMKCQTELLNIHSNAIAKLQSDDAAFVQLFHIQETESSAQAQMNDWTTNTMMNIKHRIDRVEWQTLNR